MEELTTIINDDQKAVFVAVDEDDQVLGYAFTQLQEQPFSTNMVQFKSSLSMTSVLTAPSAPKAWAGPCLIMSKLKPKDWDAMKTLNVWEGNDSAINFYKKNGLKVKETNMELFCKQKPISNSETGF
nr:GNAT family N-acetyltransferase [Lactobacillus delbrueckii]